MHNDIITDIKMLNEYDNANVFDYEFKYDANNDVIYFIMSISYGYVNNDVERELYDIIKRVDNYKVGDASINAYKDEVKMSFKFVIKSEYYENIHIAAFSVFTEIVKKINEIISRGGLNE